MPTTPGGLVYPALSATPDVPFDIKAAVESVEAKYSGTPRAKLVAAANQSIPNGAATTVDFAGGSVAYDVNPGTSQIDIANDQLIIRKAGLYRLYARDVFASNANGYRALLVQLNGAATWVADQYVQAANGQLTIQTLASEPIAFALNDTLRLQVVQTSGGALNLTTGNGRYSHLAFEWVASQ